MRPSDAESHFELARAIGRTAQTMGTKDKVKYAGVVHDEAMAALKIDPRHPGALHVMGEWNAEVMRLNGFSRFMAKNILGGKTFGEASWDNAQKYMEQAVAIDSMRITHHLDLAMIYRDRDMKDKAREQFSGSPRLRSWSTTTRSSRSRRQPLCRSSNSGSGVVGCRCASSRASRASRRLRRSARVALASSRRRSSHASPALLPTLRPRRRRA